MSLTLNKGRHLPLLGHMGHLPALVALCFEENSVGAVSESDLSNGYWLLGFVAERCDSDVFATDDELVSSVDQDVFVVHADDLWVTLCVQRNVMGVSPCIGLEE